MAQTAYNINQGEAFQGMKVDSRFDIIESALAEGVAGIQFGMGVVSGTDVDKQVRIPTLNKTTLTQSTDLVSLNSTIVTVNGVAHDAVVFDTDDATTMGLIADEIATDDAVLSATYAGSGDDIVIIGANGVEISVTAVTTLGAGQPTWTQVQAVNGVYRGIALHEHKEQSSAGVQDAKYNDQDAVSYIRQGMVWVPVTLAVASDADAYMIVGGANAGKFTNSSSGNIKAGKFRSSTAGAGIAKVEVILPASV